MKTTPREQPDVSPCMCSRSNTSLSPRLLIRSSPLTKFPYQRRKFASASLCSVLNGIVIISRYLDVLSIDNIQRICVLWLVGSVHFRCPLGSIMMINFNGLHGKNLRHRIRPSHLSIFLLLLLMLIWMRLHGYVFINSDYACPLQIDFTS